MGGLTERMLQDHLAELASWRASFGEAETHPLLAIADEQQQQVLSDLVDRLKGNYPFHHPAYAGQMLKPPHPIAQAAYALAMTINPNNHALDGGPPTSEMEKECVAQLAEMVGYGERYLGHLTSGGTVANLEALWIAKCLHPGKKIAFTENAHYTHGRMCSVLGVETVMLPCHADGLPDVEYLKAHLDEVGTVVVTMTTTGLGTVEPLHDIADVLKGTDIRIHADAAYGGFFKLLEQQEHFDGKPWALLDQCDSIVIDPHKHGLQPYGCGSVLFKDPAVGKFYKHDSPYTYFTSDDLHLGEISLECSRAGAAAAAFWATLKLFPLKTDTGFGPILDTCRQAALKMHDLLSDSPFFAPYQQPDTDIVGYFPISPEEKTTTEVSNLSKAIFNYGMEMREEGFYVSLFRVNSSHFVEKFPEYEKTGEQTTILRSVLMKPEHFGFVETLVERLEKAFQVLDSDPY